MLPQFLLLGASGQLGNALVQEFAREELCYVAKTHESLDITHLAEVREQVELLQPSMVINAAAFTDEMAAEVHREEAWKVNTEAVANLVKVCAVCDIPLIHFSTAGVFGDFPAETDRTETTPMAPKGWCNQTKAAGELAILGLGQCLCPEIRNYNFRYWIIRTGPIIEKPDLRASKNLIYRFVAAAKGRPRWALPAAIDTRWSVTYAPHLAKVVAWLAVHHNEVVSGVYHICNEGNVSLNRLFSNIGFQIPGIQVRPCLFAEMSAALDFDDAVIPRNMSLDCSKWAEIAPFRMPSVHDAISEFASFL